MHQVVLQQVLIIYLTLFYSSTLGTASVPKGSLERLPVRTFEYKLHSLYSFVSVGSDNENTGGNFCPYLYRQIHEIQNRTRYLQLSTQL